MPSKNDADKEETKPLIESDDLTETSEEPVVKEKNQSNPSNVNAESDGHEESPEVKKEELFAPDEPVNTKPEGKFKRFLHKLGKNKKVSIPLAVLAIVLVLLAVPFTRYKVLGLVLKQSVGIYVKDSKTGQAVTEASVSVGGKTAITGSDGVAHVSGVPVGNGVVVVTKKYYNDAKSNILVPIRKPKSSFEVSLEANGRQIPVKVTNKITGSAIENVLIKTGDVQARTDKDGKATIVVPADKDKVTLTLSADGYNSKDNEIEVSQAITSSPTFEIVPAGKVYFLSKLSGKVDVVKTNLDGTDRQVVLAGTGKEETGDTILLAARDWKYLALKSKRDGGDNAKLFLIDTSTDKAVTMDEGKASFSLNGWSGHNFVYTVNRDGLSEWDDKRTALKSYDADAKKIVILDESRGLGTGYTNYASESLSNVYVLEGKVIYTKVWSQNSNFTDLASRKSTIMSVNPNGQNKTNIKEVQVSEQAFVTYIDAKLYAPDELYFRVEFYGGQKTEFWEYDNGKISIASDVKEDIFRKFYPTFLLSPSAKQTLWYEPRDGKNTLFVGDQDGKKEKQIGALSEYLPYGWYTDEYLLVSKNSSELYIMPKTGLKDGTKIQKITDYHKPSADFTGYGGGYGGF